MTGDRKEEDALAPSHRDAQKSYVTIPAQEIEEGLEELERPARGLFASGVRGSSPWSRRATRSAASCSRQS